MAKQRMTDPYTFMKGLKDSNMAFEVKKTLFTMELSCDYGDFKWISEESELPQKELYFIKMVSDAVAGLPIDAVDEVETRTIKYFDTRAIYGRFENCYEVDISGAYWAYAKEFLPPDIYERGLTVSKGTRLAALGGLAKTTTTMIFDGQAFTSTHTYTRPTRNFFFYCAKKTGDIVSDVLSLCDCPLFYWVDAVFTGNKNDLAYIHAVLQNNGLGFSQYFCESITADEDKVTVFSKEHYDKQVTKARTQAQKDNIKPYRVFNKERLSSNHFIGKFKDYLYKDISTR